MSESKYYGVSTGDGNDGVCHTFPGYIVKTDKPYELAEKAARSEFKKDKETQSWVTDNMEIDGEEEYTISAVFHESKGTQDERDKIENAVEVLSDYCGRDLQRKLESITENFGCDYDWLIVEIFPIEDKIENYTCMIYDSIEDAGL